MVRAAHRLLLPTTMARPRRLGGISYVGPAAYFITSCTLDRCKAFTTNDFCDECQLELLATSQRFGFSATAYCFMPDHVHYLVSGTRADASLPDFVSMWKQRTGFAWHKRTGKRLWQKGYYEHMLRSDEAHLPIARYILENPVRAGLVRDIRDYPWLGSDRFSIDEIMAAFEALGPR
ncbi:MAG: transposase [Vicinamibacterales bacterium]